MEFKLSRHTDGRQAGGELNFALNPLRQRFSLENFLKGRRRRWRLYVQRRFTPKGKISRPRDETVSPSRVFRVPLSFSLSKARESTLVLIRVQRRVSLRRKTNIVVTEIQGNRRAAAPLVPSSSFYHAGYSRVTLTFRAERTLNGHCWIRWRA